MTEFKIGDVVCHKRWVHETGIIKEIKNIHAKKYANVIMNDGSWEQWYFTDLISATPAQIAEYYTVKIDGVLYRFYEKDDIIWIYDGSGNCDSLKHICIGESFAVKVINKYYKHLIFKIKNVEDIIPPTKGDE